MKRNPIVFDNTSPNHVYFSVNWETFETYLTAMPGTHSVCALNSEFPDTKIDDASKQELIKIADKKHLLVDLASSWLVDYIRNHYPSEKSDHFYKWESPVDARETYLKEYLTQHDDKFCINRGMFREENIITEWVGATFLNDEDAQAFRKVVDRLSQGIT